MKTFSKVIAFIGMIAMLFSLVGCKNPNGSNGGGEQPDAPITSIEFTTKQIIDGILPLTTGDVQNLIVKDSNGNTVKGTDITWTSSDPEVATVKTGKVTALKAGQTVIKAEYKTFEATVTVKVTDYVPTGINISKEKANLYIGKELSLEITLTPYDKALPENAEVEWTSSDDEICSVTRDENNKSKAKIEGIKAGDATITVKYGDFEEKTCVVTVTADPNAPKEWPVIPAGNNATQINGSGVWIYLDNSELGISGDNAATVNLQVEMKKEDGSVVEMGDTSPQFDDYGTSTVRIYFTIKEGFPAGDTTKRTVTITGKVNGSTYKSSVTFVGSNYSYDYKPESIAIKEQNVTLEPGSTKTLTVIGTPYNIDVTPDCEWSISCETDVATIDENGVITAGTTSGTATVTAKYDSLTAEANITIGDITYEDFPVVSNENKTTRIEGNQLFLWYDATVFNLTVGQKPYDTFDFYMKKDDGTEKDVLNNTGNTQDQDSTAGCLYQPFADGTISQGTWTLTIKSKSEINGNYYKGTFTFIDGVLQEDN